VTVELFRIMSSCAKVSTEFGKDSSTVFCGLCNLTVALQNKCCIGDCYSDSLSKSTQVQGCKLFVFVDLTIYLYAVLHIRSVLSGRTFMELLKCEFYKLDSLNCC